MPRPSTLRFGPFTGGINRSVARTQLAANELWDAQGFTTVESGRMRACWEGTAVDTVNGISNTAKALKSANSGTDAAPDRVTYWKAAKKLVFLNDYAAGLSNDTVLLADSGPANTSAGSTVTNGSMTVKVESTLRWEADDDVAVTGTDGVVRRYRATNNGTFNTDIPSGNSAAGRRELRIDRPYEGATEVPTLVTVGRRRNIWALDYGDWLLVCPDGEPARAFHIDEIKNGTTAQFVADDGVRERMAVGYAPVWLGFDWYSPGTVTTANTLTYAGATITNTSSLHGYGAAVPSPYNKFLTAAIVFEKSGSIESEDFYSRGTAVTASSNTTTTASPFFDKLRMSTSYRLLKLHGHAALRNPISYQGGIVCAEGRHYDYVSGLNAGAAALATVSGITVTIASDITSKVSAGYRIAIYENSSANHNPRVNVGFSNDAFVATIDKISISGGTTTMTLDHTFDPAPTNGAGVLCHFFRPLEKRERRRVWFLGRPANVTEGWSIDRRDFTYIDPLNNAEIGNDADGDITLLSPQSDARVIVGLENAIYQILGDLPSGGIAPPNFAIQPITFSSGVYRDTAAVWDDTGQVMYYAGTRGGLYALYGSATQRIDDAVRDHPNFAGKRFSHLAFSNGVLAAKTDENDPYIWFYHARKGGIWTYTRRVNSGQGQQQSDGAALPLSNGSYASNRLFNGAADHGGIWAPYRSTDEKDRFLVAYSNGTDYEVRTLNFGDHEHNNANLLHGCQAQTGFFDGQSVAPKRTRQVRLLNTKPTVIDASTSTSFNELRVIITNSEGETTLSRDVTPDWSDSQGDSEHYRSQGTGGRGDTSISITLNDGISPIGEVDSIEADIIPLEWRRR